MSLTSAMNVGVSGLGINAEAITVVGNNIANVNTTGYKEGRTLFSDMLSQNIGTGQVGRGGQIQAIQNNFSQGGFDNTSNGNDLAIQGDSFFVVQNGLGTQYFTRAGAFNYNNSNVLVNPDGLEVMGYGIIADTGQSNGVLGTIDKTNFATLPSKTTTSASFVVNLDSTATPPGSSKTSAIRLLGDFGQVAAGLTPPATVATFFDEFGNAQTANITWGGGGAGGANATYTYSITIPNAIAGTDGSAAKPITGSLNFPTPTTTSVSANITLNNGAQPMPVTFELSSMANSVAAVAPTYSQDGTAGQATGTVAIAGGTNVAGVAVPAFTTDTGAALLGTTGTNVITLNPAARALVTLGMSVASSAGTIPAGTVVTGINGNTITVSNALTGVGVLPAQTLTFSGNGATTTTTAPLVIGSNTIALTSAANMVVGQYLAGVGIPANTYITAINGLNVTLSNAATAATAAGGTINASNIHFNLVDSAGAVRSGALIPGGANWQAVVDGASNTITGTLTAGASGSTWTQAANNFVINGANQNVMFDFSQATNAATAPTITATGFNIASPSTTSNFANSTLVYDSQGNAHTATVYYRKTGANAWDYHVSIPDATSINGMQGNNVLNGTLTFDKTGILINQNPSNTNGFTVQFPGNVAAQTVVLDLNPNTSTQTASASVVTTQNQNGYGAGNLLSTSIDAQGFVTAKYSNSQTQRIAQIATAKFAAVAGLEKAGNSLFNATLASGTALLGAVDSQGGKIFSNSLEQSNVDMATQLVNMIRLQRAYSGNSKTITTADSMMQETLQLVR